MPREEEDGFAAVAAPILFNNFPFAMLDASFMMKRHAPRMESTQTKIGSRSAAKKVAKRVEAEFAVAGAVLSSNIVFGCFWGGVLFLKLGGC